MTEKLKQTIKEEIGDLPQEAQNAIATVDWVKITEEIALKFSLDEDELESLQLETLLALAGITDLEFYAINIENHVETTKEKAKNIAREAFSRIFTPIKNVAEAEIKKNLDTKNTDWEQNLNFVLSGGDYASFMAKKDDLDKNK